MWIRGATQGLLLVVCAMLAAPWRECAAADDWLHTSVRTDRDHSTATLTGFSDLFDEWEREPDLSAKVLSSSRQWAVVTYEKSPKTLFNWPLASEKEDKAEHEDKIVTDRPHFCEASSLVGLGRVQLETGYSFFQDNERGTRVRTFSFPEPLLRVGVLAEWFEFRLGYNYLIEQTRLAEGGFGRASGSDDLYVAAKLALTEQAGWLPEMAIFPQMRVPTGSRAFTNNQVLPGFNLAYSWVITDWLEVECNSQLNRRRDDTNQFYAEFIQAVNLEYELTNRIGAFTEWFCFVPNGSATAQTQHYFHAGFVYFVTDNIQLDIHSAVGLNRAADDLALTGVGCSIRY